MITMRFVTVALVFALLVASVVGKVHHSSRVRALQPKVKKARFAKTFGINPSFAVLHAEAEALSKIDFTYLKTFLTDDGKAAVDQQEREGIKKLKLKREYFTEQRQAVHDRILASALSDAQEFAATVPGNTVFALRGNTAVGKTSLICDAAKFPEFKDVGQLKRFSTINPDAFKESLLEADGSPGVRTNNDVHAEGSYLSSVHLGRLLELRGPDGSPLSYLVDKRFGKASDVAKLYNDNVKDINGRFLRMVDIEAPLRTSVTGVLCRRNDGKDPLPPFEAISTRGFVLAVGDRRAVIELFTKTIGARGKYELFMTNPDFSKDKVATVSDGAREPVIERGKEEAYAAITPESPNDAEASCAAFGAQVFTDDMVEDMCASYPNDCCKASLGMWIGATVKNAVDSWSGETRVEPPRSPAQLATKAAACP